MAKKKIDYPEVLAKIQTLKFGIEVLQKDLESHLNESQQLFGLNEKEFNQKLNGFLVRLEYFVNVTLESKINWFKDWKKQIKKIARLN